MDQSKQGAYVLTCIARRIKMRNSIVATYLSFIMLISVVSAVYGKDTVSSPEDLLSMLNKAIKKNNEAMAMQTCTTEYWNDSKTGSAKKLFNQAVRKEMKFKKTEVNI